MHWLLKIKQSTKLIPKGNISDLLKPIKLIALSFSDFLGFFHHGKKDAYSEKEVIDKRWKI
jgi:hypothetical protein